MRKYARTDDNQTQIVRCLKAVGATVQSTATIGGGFVDIVVGFRGTNYLFEVKDGNKPPSARKLTEDEKKFFAGWQGQVDVIDCVDDVLVIIGAIKGDRK